jgi:hypothetical protein
MESIIHGAWLADVDSVSGKTFLKHAINVLPAAPFLRLILAAHFVTRVYWSHWKKQDRLILLNAAEMVIKPLHWNIDKQGLMRVIESDRGDVESRAG